MQIDLSYSPVEKSSSTSSRTQSSGDETPQKNTLLDLNDSMPSELGCMSLFDGRRRIEYFGQLFPKEQMLSWLKTAVDYRFDIDSVPVLEQSDTVPAMVLKKAYISRVATSMTAVVVLVVKEGSGEQVFRGSKTRLNWAGTDKEFSRILSEALDDALSTVTFEDSFGKDCSKA